MDCHFQLHVMIGLPNMCHEKTENDYFVNPLLLNCFFKRRHDDQNGREEIIC
jgi:hypothetical protein